MNIKSEEAKLVKMTELQFKLTVEIKNLAERIDRLKSYRTIKYEDGSIRRIPTNFRGEF